MVATIFMALPLDGRTVVFVFLVTAVAQEQVVKHLQDLFGLVNLPSRRTD